jgi:dTDP-4-amino-4,6-dideoxygalactose transaminase
MTSVNEEGIEKAIELMRQGWLNRYQPTGDEMAYLLQVERAFADYIGVRWCLGVNSGASAIFLAIKCAGIAVDSPILTNAFTFNAVPASIVHAGCAPVLVECTDTYTIDLIDLERKIESSGSKVLILSYMRGRIPDIDEVLKICRRNDIYLIEDAAHAYACEWKGKRIGSFGQSACVSTQANKLMNSGEGGFLLTNDDHVMAKAICSAGSYEEYFLKHKELSPPRELMLEYRMTCVNYSMRMTNLQGAILLPQVALLNDRREILNRNYEQLVSLLSSHPKIHVPPQLPEVTPVYDSLQFTVEGMDETQLRDLVMQVKAVSGIKLGVFGFRENARNYRTWKFIDGLEDMSLPMTEKIIAASCDTRLDLEMTQEQMHEMVEAITTSVDLVAAGGVAVGGAVQQQAAAGGRISRL